MAIMCESIRVRVCVRVYVCVCVCVCVCVSASIISHENISTTPLSLSQPHFLQMEVFHMLSVHVINRAELGHFLPSCAEVVELNKLPVRRSTARRRDGRDCVCVWECVRVYVRDGE